MLYTWFFVENAVLGIPYGRSGIFCIEFICNLSNPQALCASSFAKGAHTIGCCFVSLLRKGRFPRSAGEMSAKQTKGDGAVSVARRKP